MCIVGLTKSPGLIKNLRWWFGCDWLLYKLHRLDTLFNILLMFLCLLSQLDLSLEGMECAEGVMSKRFKVAFYEEELSEFLSIFIPGMPGMDTVDRMISERNIDVSRAQTLSDELSYMVDPLTGESVDHFADRNRDIAKMIIKLIMKLKKCRGYIDDFYLKFDALRRESIRRSLASGWADEERAQGGGIGGGFDEFEGMDFDLNEEDMDEIRDVMRDVEELRDLVTESGSEDDSSDYD